MYLKAQGNPSRKKYLSMEHMTSANLSTQEEATNEGNLKLATP